MPTATRTREKGRNFEFVDGGKQVCDTRLAEAFKLKQVFLVQGVQVGDLPYQALFEQDGGLLDAEPLDVHRALAYEVLKEAHKLCGTGRVDAEVGRLALGADDGLGATWALAGHLEGRLVAGALADDGRHDLRDDLPGPLDDHPVADTEVLGRNVVGVVEGGLPDGDAVDVDGFQDGVGIDAARPANVDLDLAELCRRLRGRELVGDGPSRLSAHDAEVPLVVEAVDLHDDAVAAVVEVFPALNPPPAVVERLVGSADECAVWIRFEAETREGLNGLPVRVELHRLGVAQGVDVDIEGTCGRGARVELADGACGGVAWVSVWREAVGDALLVEGLEFGFREDDLASNLEAARQPQAGHGGGCFGWSACWRSRPRRPRRCLAWLRE